MVTGSVIGEKTLNSSLIGDTIRIGIGVPLFVVISILLQIKYSNSRIKTQTNWKHHINLCGFVKMCAKTVPNWMFA